MKLTTLRSELDSILKIDLAYDWDNVGLLVGQQQSYVRGITLALELSDEVIKDAKANGSNLIITHHPLIFSPINTLVDSDVKQGYIMELVKEDIALYAAHTNFDRIDGGLNDYVIRLLDVDDVRNFIQEEDGHYMGKVAKMKKAMSPMEFEKHVADKLDVNDLRLVAKKDRSISKVVLVTGSGASYIEAANQVADIIVTGDVKYHDGQDAYQRGDMVIDAGHFGTEKFFAKAMEQFLEKNLSVKLPMTKSDGLCNPFRHSI